jgi:Fe-S-cluster containining protein
MACLGSSSVAALLGVLDLKVCDGCSDCALRCTDDIPMALAEFEAISAYCTREIAPATCKHSASAPAQLPDAPWPEPCRFRIAATGMCRVYPVRPLVCRLMGHVWWLPCPVGRVTSAPDRETVRSALDAYCAEERRTYAGWTQSRAGTNCEEETHAA